MNNSQVSPALIPLVIALLCQSSRAQQEQSPALPDTVVDLRTDEGAQAVAARWAYTEAHVVPAKHRAPGLDLKASGEEATTNDIHPRLGTPDFDAAPWTAIAPCELESRRTNGRLAFGWYKLDITVPAAIGNVPTTGGSLILEVVVDDYAEIAVNGRLTQVLGQSGGGVVSGWNAPSRVTLTTNAVPGDSYRVAIFAANGPLSAPPSNFVWIRSATLDLYTAGRGMVNPPIPVETKIDRMDAALDSIIAPGARAERLATGFHFTEGPVWVPRLAVDRTYGGGGQGGYLLFSDPNKNVIHRWEPSTGEVSIFRTKSGYAGIGGGSIGEYHQPGSNGLTLDADGRLTICEHGNRRVSRLEPNGGLTILADRFDGKRLNSPNDLVYRSDGVLFFTDPPFGLPRVFDDPRKELPFSGVFSLRHGELSLAASELRAPNGLAFSPDEKYLYVDNWDVQRKVVLRYEVSLDATLSNPTTFVDLTSLPGELCFDGLKVDRAGNVYLSAPDGLRIYDPDGLHLGTIVLPELPANFTFGDEDARTLYMTARTGLYRIRTRIPGK